MGIIIDEINYICEKCGKTFNIERDSVFFLGENTICPKCIFDSGSSSIK